MRVNVVCFGALRDYLPDRSAGSNHAPLDLATGSRVADVVAALGIPEASVYALLVDGDKAALDTELYERAEVTLMPPFAGGA